MLRHPGVDPLMHDEWIAWRLMCKELELVGVDVNLAEMNRFVMACKHWGEQLVALRLSQDIELVEEARDYNRRVYQLATDLSEDDLD